MANCVNGSSHQQTLFRRFLKEERQIYTVYLKVNTVIAIGNEMIFVYTVSAKLSSTSLDLTPVDHQAQWRLLSPRD